MPSLLIAEDERRTSVFNGLRTQHTRGARQIARTMRLFALRPYHPPCPARLPAPYRSAKTDRLPAGWTRDAALLRVVNVGGLDEPMPAWNLALSIHDRGMRREALGTAFAAMVASDPAGGTLLHQARLPEAELRPPARMLAAGAGVSSR